MTTHAVSSPSTGSIGSAGAAKTSPQDPLAKPFEHQLHAARQGQGSNAQQTPSHESHPRRGPDPGRDRRSDPTPLGPNARHLGDTAKPLGKESASRPDENAASSTAAGAAPTPATQPVMPEAVEAALGTAVAESGLPEKSLDGSEEGAAALVGAVLAMVGPAVGKMLAPAGAAKPAAVDANAAAALLQSGGAAIAASMVMPKASPITGDMLGDLKPLHESATADLASTMTSAASTAPLPQAPAPVSATLSVPAGSHGFAQELGQQVAWFVGQDIKQARIRLHPEELGSLDLKISVSHGRVDVIFQAQHPGAVTAVQQSLPQLDQMLAQHGLSLGNAEVSQQHRGDQGSHGRSDGDTSETAEIHSATLLTPIGQVGLLDAFA